MKTIYREEDRGGADHGWLQAKHSFSFADYYDPDKVNFGVLRVLNDDIIAAGKGFGTHPHDNMEIVSIVLSGELEHKDSMGNTSVIKEGDIQVMSAGTGIMHSEYNKRSDIPVKILQIWIIPNKHDVEPRYDQINIKNLDTHNQFQQILSPNPNDHGVWIHQNAWFNIGEFAEGKEVEYNVNSPKNGVYIFVLEGSIQIDGDILNKRDAIGLSGVTTASFITNSFAKLLVMEVPMDY